MTEVLIYTTTCPDKLFGWDIFDWNAWLNEATLQQLYSGATALEDMYQVYTIANKEPGITYQEHEENAVKAHFYHRLVVAIYQEIARRKYPVEGINRN